MRKMVGDGTELGNFRTHASDLLESTDMESELDRHFEMLAQKIDTFVRNGKKLFFLH